MTYPSILCHPDDLAEVGIWSGWVTAMLFCHPDEIHFHFLSHPYEIANFDFPHHAVALQCFRRIPFTKDQSVMLKASSCETLDTWMAFALRGVNGHYSLTRFPNNTKVRIIWRRQDPGCPHQPLIAILVINFPVMGKRRQDLITNQQTHYAIMTLLLRQNDVILTWLPQNDVLT